MVEKEVRKRWRFGEARRNELCKGNKVKWDLGGGRVRVRRERSGGRCRRVV